MSLLNFIQYHNAVPIALGIIFLGAGATFAATNPEVIYSAEQQIVSIDNTYLANKDFEHWTPQIRISTVTEDEESYHVAYELSTVDLDGYVWKDIVKGETMSVSKADLGQYRDLGVYVTQQLRQIIDRDLQRLKETQAIEKRSVSHAVVATAYSGLVGALLTDSTETLPGYTPVVKPPETATPPEVASGGAGSTAGPSNNGGLGVGSVLSGDPSDKEPPFLQILGSPSIQLQEGDYYLDLGAVAADNGNRDAVEVSLYLNGASVERVYMVSARLGEWVVTYEARDKAGNITRAERRITVIPNSSPLEQAPAPAPDSTIPTSSTGSLQAGSGQASSTQAEPATTTPEVTPEPTPTSTPETAPAATTPEVTPEPTPTPTPEPTPTQTPEPTPTPPSDTPVTS